MYLMELRHSLSAKKSKAAASCLIWFGTMDQNGQCAGPDELEFVTTHVPYKTARWTFKIEEFRKNGKQYLLVHAICKKPGPSAIKEAKSAWAQFRRVVTAPLYALNSSSGDQRLWKHFVTMFGFEPTGISVTLNNGVQRELFINHGTADLSNSIK